MRPFRTRPKKKKRNPIQVTLFLIYMVPKAGFEPARVSPPPPQDGVSTKFHHFGIMCLFCRFCRCRGLFHRCRLLRRCGPLHDRSTTAMAQDRQRQRGHHEQDGSRRRQFGQERRGPGTAENGLAGPPKAAPMPAPRPVCSRTMKISARLTIIWTM